MFHYLNLTVHVSFPTQFTYTLNVICISVNAKIKSESKQMFTKKRSIFSSILLLYLFAIGSKTSQKISFMLNCTHAKNSLKLTREKKKKPAAKIHTINWRKGGHEANEGSKGSFFSFKRTTKRPKLVNGIFWKWTIDFDISRQKKEDTHMPTFTFIITFINYFFLLHLVLLNRLLVSFVLKCLQELCSIWNSQSRHHNFKFRFKLTVNLHEINVNDYETEGKK